MKTLLIALATIILNVSVEADVPDLMERSGTSHMLNAVPEQFEIGFLQGLSQAGLGEEITTDVSELVEHSLDATVLITNVTAALEAKLSKKDIRALTNWYATPLAQRITELENQANSADQLERIAASLDSLLADQHRVTMAKQVESALDATDQSLQMAQLIQNAMFAAMLRDVDAAQKKLIVDQADAALQQGRGEFEKYVLASIVSTYESLDDAELQTYITFLKQPAAQNFYDISQDALTADLADMVGNIGAALVEMLKAKLASPSV